MTGERFGRSSIGFAVLLLIALIMSVSSGATQFGLEWLYSRGTKLISQIWAQSPALCLMAVASAGGIIGYWLAMKAVADQLVRERWDRKCRSTTLDLPGNFHLRPVQVVLTSTVPPRSYGDTTAITRGILDINRFEE